MKKENILFIFLAIFIMATTGIVTSYAVTSYLYTSNEISYNNSSTGITSDNLQSAIYELYEDVDNYKNINDLIYPVGSIYMSVTDDTVAKVQARFGGTWEVFAQGKTLVGVNTSETEFNTIMKTGGEKTHKLTISEMPTHRHTLIRQQWFGADATYSTSARVYSWKTTTGGATSYSYKTNVSDLGADGTDMLTTGGNSAHNNLPPYFTVYMYRRLS